MAVSTSGLRFAQVENPGILGGDAIDAFVTARVLDHGQASTPSTLDDADVSVNGTAKTPTHTHRHAASECKLSAILPSFLGSRTYQTPQPNEEDAMNPLERRFDSFVGSRLLLLLLTSTVFISLSAYAQTPIPCPSGSCSGNGNCETAAIVINGTSLGADNIEINSTNLNSLEVYWTVHSPCGNGSGSCDYPWGGPPLVVLDGAAGNGGGVTNCGNGTTPAYDCQVAYPFNEAESGQSGFPREPIPLKSRYILNETCKHTLQIWGRVGCAASGFTYQASNPITVWIDNQWTPEIENMETCTNGPPVCQESTPGSSVSLQPTVGNPVNLASGKMFHEMVDLRIDGPLPIEFVRRYDSTWSSTSGPLGFGWQHNGMLRIEGLSNPQSRVFIDKHMRKIIFNCWNPNPTADPSAPFPVDCTWDWWPDKIDHLILTEPTSTTWRVTDDRNKTRYDFDSDGKLQVIRDRNNNTLTYGYNATTGKLETITDSFGRAMGITYVPGTDNIHTVSAGSGAGSRTVTYSYTTGELTHVAFPDGSSVDYAYGSGHKLTSATDALGNIIESHEYTGEKVTKTKAHGDNYFYEINYPDPAHTTVKNARNVTTTFTIVPFSGVAKDRTGGPGCSSCGDDGDETQKLYDHYLNVTDIIDGSGVTTHMTYDDTGNGDMLTRTENYQNPDLSPARTTTYTYHPVFSFPETISVPTAIPGSCTNADRLITNDYSARGNLISQEIKGCNGAGSFTHTVNYTYDEPPANAAGLGQLLTVNGPRDDATDVLDLTQYEYYPNLSGLLNDRGRLKRATRGKNTLNHHTDYADYDLFGNVGKVTDPNGVETSYLYDGKDRVTEVRITDPVTSSEIVTKYEYDLAGNLHRVRLPECFELGTMTCPFSWELMYDEVNRLEEVHDAVGNKIVYSYDKEGNRTREEFLDATATPTRYTNFEYDNFNRLKKVCHNASTSGACGSIFDEFMYFPDGRRQKAIDPMGHDTTFGYDTLKRLRTVEQELGAGTVTTAYDYDRLDGLKSVTDPNGLITTFKNGDRGWRLETVSPDTGTTGNVYDEAGNLKTSTSANGVTTARAYDELNRPTTIQFGTDSALTVTNSYDSPSVTFGIGRRTGLSDASGSSTFGYDLRGLLKTEQRNTGGLIYTTGYDYDKNGNLTELRYPTSNSSIRQGKVTYGYDAADRVELVETEVGGTPTTIANSLAYKPFGPRTDLTFGSTLTDQRTFDTRYRIDTWTLGSGLLNYAHTFDNDDNLEGRLDNSIPDHSYDRTYGYDELHRLVSATGPWLEASTCTAGATYEYDDNGNRICKGEFGTSTNYSITSGTNRLFSSGGGESASYGYDANGNVTGDGTHTYQYSQADRLATVDSGATASYKYDGDNRRALKTTPVATTNYFYDISGRLIQEFVPATGSGKDYVYLDGSPIARVDWTLAEQDSGDFLRVNKSSPNVRLDWSLFSGSTDGFVVRRKQMISPTDRTFVGAIAIAMLDASTETFDDPVLTNGNSYDYRIFKLAVSDALFFYHTDHLGTPIAMTDGSSAPVWRAEHLPFGGLLSTPTFANNLRFSGQYFDLETGHHQNWFRDYDPKSGRYTGADPIGLLGGPNLYVYAQSNPTNATDPLGLCGAGARDSRCGPRPKAYPAPEGESIGRDLAWATSVNPLQYYQGIKNFGPKDYKRRYRGDPVAEQFGNFSFGATAYLQGFDDLAPDFIQWGAGAYSWWSNLGVPPNQQAPSFGTPIPMPFGWPILPPVPIWPYGDDLPDAHAIADGIQFAKWFACRAGLE